MKIVFFGTPDYVLPVLTSLHKKFVSGPGVSPIAAVVTQSPKPTGRKQILTYSPVDKWAHEHKITTYYDPQNLLKEKIKFDLGVIADYGKIISKEVIGLFANGILNIHFSPLPKYRGASPVQAAILSGDKEIGVTIFKIDERLDHGPIISQFKEEVGPTDTWGSLKVRLFERTKDVFIELIPPYIGGKIKTKKQDEKDASYTILVKKEHGFIPPKYLRNALEGKSLKEDWEIGFIKDFSLAPSPSSLEKFIRALDPWPLAWTFVKMGSNQKRLKILNGHVEEEKLILDLVQLEGKNPVSWQEFLEGYPTATFE